MKRLLLILAYISIYTANAQNGFTTYTTNLTITGAVKNQTALLVDNSGNKWIGFRTLAGSPNAGLVKYDNSNWTVYGTLSTPALPSNSVTALAQDNVGNIWIGTNVGLVKFDGTIFTTYTTIDGLPSNTITCIESIGSQIYIGTQSGLSRFNGVNFTNYNVANGKLSDDIITAIKAESSSLIWIGGIDHLVEFNINGTFTSSSFIDHIIPNSPGIINCIHIDNQNAKWLGTTNVGILKYAGSTFQNASSLYVLFGSTIPNSVLDISEGLNGGVAFIHRQTETSGLFNGITELAPNNEVFQYFYPSTNISIGVFIEKEGSNLLISQGYRNNAYISPKMYYSFNKSNYEQQLGNVNTNNFKTLDINNVRAGIANRGDMHWNIGGNGNALYEVPKGSGISSNFASALWIGGLDDANQLHGAAQTYRQGGVDFWPGPLDTVTSTIDVATSTNYDKIWKVSYTDINTFINAFNSGSVVATPDMLTWPAKGTGNNSRNLAPYVDFNHDGNYNPNDGDYPKIKGDQTLYFIYNDMLSTHSTSFTPMGVEVQGMAYAYGCPTVVSGKPELSYTTFYDYKIINRSSNNYHDVYVSMWSDVDLGYYGDDYIGSNVADNYGFAYNSDNDDQSVSGTSGYGAYIPAQGFNILKGPLANTMDGIDNNNNGITDEIGEDCKLNKFNYFNNLFAGVSPNTTDPTTGSEYYNIMTGKWKDGTPFTCGGDGYVGTINTNWAYTGDPNNVGVNTDPNNTCGYWTETTGTVTPGDRRMILSSGPFTLNAGQMQEVEYAFVTSFDSTSATNSNMLSIAKLKTDIQKVNAFYNQVNKPNCLQAITVGITEVAKQNDFMLFPNPAKSFIKISSNINGNVKINYEVVDVLGKVVLQNENNNSEQFSININDLNSGIYFLRLQVNNSIVVKKFVKE
jgi:hypothetical protein